MDIVDFWEKQVKIWNDTNKCGLCWEFAAPLTESAVNIVQQPAGTECCVKVFLVRQGVTAFSSTNTYNTTTGYVNQVTCNTSFQLIVVAPSTIGTNNYNEIKGHSTDESKWTTILSKIEQCLSCEAYLDFCTILGNQYRVTNWSGTQLINYLDTAYAGYRVTVTFQTVR